MPNGELSVYAHPVASANAAKQQRQQTRLISSQADMSELDVQNYDANQALKDRQVGAQETSAGASAMSAGASLMNAQRMQDGAALATSKDQMSVFAGMQEIAQAAENVRSTTTKTLGPVAAQQAVEAFLTPYQNPLKQAGMGGMPTDQVSLQAMSTALAPFKADTSLQQVQLIHSGTGEPVAGNYNPDPNAPFSYTVAATGADASTEYFVAPASTSLGELGPTRADKTQLRLRKSQLLEGQEIIKAVTTDILGIAGTINWAVNTGGNIAEDITEIIPFPVINQMLTGAQALVGQIVEDTPIGEREEMKAVLDVGYQSSTSTIDLFEYALGLTLARGSQPTGRIPVELIKMSIESVQLSGFSSEEDVTKRLQMLNAMFDASIKHIDQLMEVVPAGSDPEVIGLANQYLQGGGDIDLLKELGIDISSLGIEIPSP